MEIPEPTLEVERGQGEVAGKKAKMRRRLSQLGKEEYPDLRLLAAGPGQALGGLCCPCRLTWDGSLTPARGGQPALDCDCCPLPASPTSLHPCSPS